MSTCRKEGKDVIIFATADDHKEPSSVKLPELDPSTNPESEPREGYLLPNGEINWDCPCLGGMASGPCGKEFREAFTCFHYSEADPKGSECLDAFQEMQLCMAEYTQIYNESDVDVEDDKIDMKLSDAEKALISDDNEKKTSEDPKVGNFPKIEDKPTEKVTKVTNPEPKSSSKPATLPLAH